MTPSRLALDIIAAHRSAYDGVAPAETLHEKKPLLRVAATQATSDCGLDDMTRRPCGMMAHVTSWQRREHHCVRRDWRALSVTPPAGKSVDALSSR